MKLYLVVTHMTGIHAKHYVVAPDPGKAYQIVRDYLDKHDLGYSDQRAMECISLVAEESDYPECNVKLHLP